MRFRSALAAIIIVATGCASDPVDLGITAGGSSTTTTAAVAETSSTTPARAPELSIAPWNGHRMALSWTFDDGDPSHLGTVVPILDAAGIPGTFYPTCAEIEDDLESWILVAEAGVHEIANHTVNHVNADDADDLAEIADCHLFLEATLGVVVSSFAYPAGIVEEPYLSYASNRYVAARAAWEFITVVRSSTAPDWTSVPSVFVGDVVADSPDDTRIDWPLRAITDTNTEAGWLTLTFHSVGTDRGYGPVSVAELEQVLAHAGQYDVWNATFADVASYHRGRLALMNLLPEATDSGGWVWTWEPALGTTVVSLLVSVGDGDLIQAGEVLEQDARGHFLVDPTLGELGWKP